MSLGPVGPLPRVVRVLSDEVGLVGGAAKATLLLCEALADGGARVFLHVTTPPDASIIARLENKAVSYKAAPIPVGSRFRLPARSNAVRAWLATRRSDAVLHAVGMQREVRQFLALPGRTRTFVWETTEALPGNKFIDPRVPALLGKVEALFVPSRAVERNARATYGFTGRAALLPFWVEDRAKGSARPAPDGATRRFLFVGRMDEDKGFRFLVPAFERVRKKRADVALDVCGSGDPARIPELRHPPAGVTARGSVPDDELDVKFASCTAFVLPSLHEGYPLTLLEACAFGKPVIASSVGSIPEVFAGRECALLVPPGDADALEAAMLQLLDEDSVRYAARCADARRLFEDLGSKNAAIEALSRAYNGER